MRALNVLLSISVSLLLAFLVLEGGLRLFPAFRPQESINEFHPQLGWTKRPNSSTDRSTSEFSIEFEINAHGLRDDQGPTKPANTYRVMALGDSFVLGYTVDRKDLFVDHLENWWNSEERRVEVINAGTEGYSTDQEALWFKEFGAAYQPDLVLVFPYENDIYWNGQEKYTRFPKPRYGPDGSLESGNLTDPGPGSALRNWAIGLFLQKVVFSRLAKGSELPPNHFKPEGRTEAIYSEFAPLLRNQPAFLADAIARTRGSLRALKNACDESGARLVMVPIPSESAIEPDEKARFAKSPQGMKGIPEDLWSPDRPIDLFLEMGRELGIETLDPRTTLRAHAKNGTQLYFDAEWHFTPEGNLAFAEYLIDELDGMGVFPEAHQAIAQGEFETREEEGGFPTWGKVFLALWALLGTSYTITYKDEPAWQSFLKVGGLLGLVFTIILGGSKLIGLLPPSIAPWILVGFVAGVLGFVLYKLGHRVATILELLKAFTLRGHWYLMPLVVVLLTIGSLLVVAASSPLIAPFIYTLF